MTEKTTILLVDDDLDFLESQKQLLVAAGYDVHTACTGKEGVEKAKSLHPHLILLDVMMNTQTEGFAANQEIRSTPELSDIPVIMLSGINTELDLPHRFDVAEGWPCVAFIEKPVLPEILLAKVREYAR